MRDSDQWLNDIIFICINSSCDLDQYLMSRYVNNSLYYEIPKAPYLKQYIIHIIVCLYTCTYIQAYTLYLHMYMVCYMKTYACNVQAQIMLTHRRMHINYMNKSNQIKIWLSGGQMRDFLAMRKWIPTSPSILHFWSTYRVNWSNNENYPGSE